MLTLARGCRGITTFSSHHFRAFVRTDPAANGPTADSVDSASGGDSWLRLDDTVIEAAGSLRAVLAACRAEGACPTLLFYERMAAAP